MEEDGSGSLELIGQAFEHSPAAALSLALALFLSGGGLLALLRWAGSARLSSRRQRSSEVDDAWDKMNELLALQKRTLIDPLAAQVSELQAQVRELQEQVNSHRTLAERAIDYAHDLLAFVRRWKHRIEEPLPKRPPGLEEHFFDFIEEVPEKGE